VLNLCGNVDCSNLDSQCTVGVCVPNTGQCEAQTANEGASCDDGNACNVGETCQSGTCTGAAPANEGNSCDDGNRCNVGETCQLGVCTGGGPVDCSALIDQCNDASCSPLGPEGNCIQTQKPPLTLCDDGNACTLGGICATGQCLSLGNTDCSASADQCNAAMCDSVTGCFSEPVLDGTQCDDDDPNTQNDICEAGVCSGDTPGGFSCGLGTTLNVITNECEPDVTQADLDSVEAQRDAILTTLFEFLRVFGVI